MEYNCGERYYSGTGYRAKHDRDEEWERGKGMMGGEEGKMHVSRTPYREPDTTGTRFFALGPRVVMLDIGGALILS